MGYAMITINCYSERGLCVKGITPEQAQTILGGLGKAVTQYNPMMGGYVFSRKREGQIRALVASMQVPAPPPYASSVNAAESLPGALPDDTMPGPWTKNAAGELIG